jgi:hypothetical protein
MLREALLDLNVEDLSPEQKEDLRQFTRAASKLIVLHDMSVENLMITLLICYQAAKEAMVEVAEEMKAEAASS